MRRLIPAFALLLGACASTLPPVPEAERPGVRIGGEGGPMSAGLVEQVTMSALARDYVGLILEIGEHEPGYVDAYYGPAEWQAEAKAGKRALPDLLTLANRMIADLEAARPTDPEVIQRKAYLIAHTRAAAARIRMLSGEKLGFADEAEALFGIRPELRPLASFDPILAQIDALVPGQGDLTDRVTAFKAQYQIPKDRLQVVMDTAIAECRRRTVQHITLPANERFTLSFVGTSRGRAITTISATRPAGSRSMPTSRSIPSGRSIWGAMRVTPDTTSTTPCWSGPSCARRAGWR